MSESSGRHPHIFSHYYNCELVISATYKIPFIAAAAREFKKCETPGVYYSSVAKYRGG